MTQAEIDAKQAKLDETYRTRARRAYEIACHRRYPGSDAPKWQIEAWRHGGNLDYRAALMRQAARS